jgi:pimeloyl-ACP methyl ester carboxylesterase
MSFLSLKSGSPLFYRHTPAREGYTFVFVNALTGNTDAWEAEIAPRLQAAGHGTLSYNMRGQTDSPLAAGEMPDQASIVSDLRQLLSEVGPARPILTGLSIGGLFAAWAFLEGAAAEGLVLINTLRAPGTRLEWINEALLRAAKVGGSRLVMDLFLPLLVGPAKIENMRPVCLSDDPYQPMGDEEATVKLLRGGASADWELPYERLTLPVLVMSGLADRVFYDAEAVAERLARLPAGHEVRLPDLGHLIPLEDGAATAGHLLAFAEQLAGQRP